ncbi:hypothetical protein KY386_03050 [Candidatus Parcubacteria bacterium]|nr:hypothetical protein [Candidatus Parcubacteria bacterium]
MEGYDDIDQELKQEKKIEETLLSDRDPVTKVRQMMRLGLDEDEANELVARFQIGQMAPVYYERLEFDYEEDE